MMISSLKPFALARSSVLMPSVDHVDAAPQLTAVALAEAALIAVDRALDSAHPILYQTTRLDRAPPDLDDTEHLAVQVVDAANHLADLLRNYAVSVHVDLANCFGHDDPPDDDPHDDDAPDF